MCRRRLISSSSRYSERTIYYWIQTTLDIAADEMDDASTENIRNLGLQAESLIEASAKTLSNISDRLTQHSVRNTA